MPNVGFQEIAVILIVALLVFGPKKLPEVGKALGQGLREFKKISNELTSSIHSMADEVEAPIKEAKSEVEDSIYKEEAESSEVEDSIYNEEEAKSKEGDA